MFAAQLCVLGGDELHLASLGRREQDVLCMKVSLARSNHVSLSTVWWRRVPRSWRRRSSMSAVQSRNPVLEVVQGSRTRGVDVPFTGEYPRQLRSGECNTKVRHIA